MMEAGSERPGTHGANGAGAAAPDPGESIGIGPRPAREMSLHLLRMLETRLEAAGIAFQEEGNRLLTRLQFQLIGAASILIGIWGGIVLLAIALPPNLRVPVLSAVVGLFALVAVGLLLKASRMVAGREVGSLHWLVESLKLDLVVLSRSLAEPTASPAPEKQEGPPNDLAA